MNPSTRIAAALVVSLAVAGTSPLAAPSTDLRAPDPRRDRSTVLRVGLADAAPEIVLGPGAYRVRAKGLDRVHRWKDEQRLRLTDRGFSLGKVLWSSPVVLSAPKEDDPVLINRRPYRGKVELERVGRAVRIVNVVGVETYLRGVLHMETNEAWPTEALKAQAVISRTYAVLNRGRHGSRGYDLCATPHCQAYGGAAAERPATDAVLRRTRGEVVMDRKKRLVSTVYHSCCGGSTESAQNVWRHAGQPHLKAARCGWCRGSPHYFWKARVPTELVTARLNAAGYDLGEVRAIGVLSRTGTGRVHRFRVYGQKRSRDIPANEFRNIVDPRRIRSTLIAGISKLDGAWQFHGRGWGHGVGLCQWGMKELADQSMAYGQILRIYYRAVEVRDWKD